MTTFRWALFVSLACFSMAEAQVGPLVELRDWTSDDGKTLRAELSDFDGETAELRLEDGRRVEVPYSRFSPPDQAELVRAYLDQNTWSNLPPPLLHRFYYSLHTSENSKEEGPVAVLRFGANAFDFTIRIHETRVDFTDYDHLVVGDGEGQEYRFDYEDKNVAVWGPEGRKVSRIPLSIHVEKGKSLMPVLQSGLDSGRLSIEARGSGVDPHRIEISKDQLAAIEDLFTIFRKAHPLVEAGVIQRELLEKQTFGAGEQGALTGGSAGEDPELERFRSSRGGGRFGKLVWTPGGGEAQTVDGLGWLRSNVVIRNAEGEVQRVPFAEIEKEKQLEIFEARLDDLAGTDLVEEGNWTYYYPKDLVGNETVYRQGLALRKGAKGGKFQLIVQNATIAFEGQEISVVRITASSLSGEIRIPVERTRTVTAPNKSWSIVAQAAEGIEREKWEGLVEADALRLITESGDDFVNFTLEGESLMTSLDAAACYLWAQDLSR